MKIDKNYLHDRRMLHRTGLAVEKYTLRRGHESVWNVLYVVWYVILAASMMVFMAPCDQAWAEVYDSNDICDAIYVIEGGAKTRHPYGILSVSCHGEMACREVCLNTVENTFTRWQASGSKQPFLEALAARYAPIGAENDELYHLNRFWLGNLRARLVAMKGGAR